MTRPMVTMGAPFLLGVLAASLLSRDFGVGLAAALVAGLLLAALFLRGRSRTLVFVSLAAGLIGCAAFLAWRDNRDFRFSELDNTSVRLSGAIEDLVPASNGRTKATIRVEPGGFSGTKRGFRAIAYLREDDVGGSYGDFLTVEGTCLSMGRTPSFDYERTLRAQGIELVIWANGATAAYNPNKSLMASIRELCGWLRDETNRLLRTPWRGLLRAILLGDDSAMDPLLNNRFQRVGITHLFVVSGLHVSLAAGMLLRLFQKLRLRQLAPVLAGLGAWGFVALTGFGLPAVRAGVMTTVLLASMLFHRPADPLNSLFLAGMLIVGTDPGAIWNASFSLTFTATLGAVTLASPISSRLARALRIRSRAGKYLCGVTGLSLACNAAMLPALLPLFRGVSLVSPLANLVAIPLLPVVLIGGVLTLASAAFPALAAFFARGTELLLQLITGAACALTETHAVYLGLDYPFVPFWLLLAGGAMPLAFLLRKRDRRLPARAAGCLAASLVLLLAFQSLWLRDTVEILPIVSFGGADAAILRDGTATVLSFADDRYLGVSTEEALRSKNIHSIENYVALRRDTREPSGLVHLGKCLPMYNLILGGEDSFLPYAEGVAAPRNGAYPLAEGWGYDLFSWDGGTCDVWREAAGELVTLRAGRTRVVFTDSLALARRTNCEILVYAGKSLNLQTVLPAEYVILLNKPQGGELPERWLPAYDEEISALVRANGSYTVRRR